MLLRYRERRGWNGCRKTSTFSISRCRPTRCGRYPRWAAPKAGSPISVSRRNGIETRCRCPLCCRREAASKRSNTVEPLRFIRSGTAASALGHLSILMVVMVFAEVHPFASVTAEPIAVDIVSPEEAVQVPKMPEPEPKSQGSDAFDPLLKSAPAASPSPQQAASPKPTAPASSQPDRREAAAQPQAPSTSPVRAYIPPEPDLSIKYHVLIGLPVDLPPDGPKDRPGDGFDAPASKPADVAST